MMSQSSQHNSSNYELYKHQLETSNDDDYTPEEYVREQEAKVPVRSKIGTQRSAPSQLPSNAADHQLSQPSLPANLERDEVYQPNTIDMTRSFYEKYKRNPVRPVEVPVEEVRELVCLLCLISNNEIFSLTNRIVKFWPIITKAIALRSTEWSLQGKSLTSKPKPTHIVYSDN